MCLAGKLVSELSINAPAEKFYKVIKETPFHVPNISPKVIQKVEVHGGDWDTHGHGSIKTWNFNVDGKAEVFTEKVEFDDEKLAKTMTGLEGDVFNHYKAFKASVQAVPKGPARSLVVLTIEYEKRNENVPFPCKYLDVLNYITKDIEAHLK